MVVQLWDQQLSHLTRSEYGGVGLGLVMINKAWPFTRVLIAIVVSLPNSSLISLAILKVPCNNYITALICSDADPYSHKAASNGVAAGVADLSHSSLLPSSTSSNGIPLGGSGHYISMASNTHPVGLMHNNQIANPSMLDQLSAL